MPDDLPNGWSQVDLGQVALVQTGGTPSRNQPAYWNGTIAWMASGEINQRRVTATAECITKAGLRSSNAKVFGPGTIMVAMNGQGSTRGRTARLAIEAACNQSLAAITATETAEQDFLFHVLDTSYEKLRKITGDGRSGLNLDLIRGFRLLLPPPLEQRAIAAVLDGIDDATEQTEAVIEATETLRGALLQELLTRGVPGWHKEWKHVQGIGTIPADWEVAQLRVATDELRYGTSTALSSIEKTHSILRIPNVARGYVDTSDLKYADLASREASALALRAGDLLIVRTNGNPSICGQSALFDRDEGHWAFASYLLRLRTHHELLDPMFLWMYLRSSSGRKQLAGNIRTSAGNYNLSPQGLLASLIPLPPRKEQDCIAEMMTAAGDALDELHKELTDLRALKVTTAGALLTGRVPVEFATEAKA